MEEILIISRKQVAICTDSHEREVIIKTAVEKESVALRRLREQLKTGSEK
jgi:hypothetical protein